MRRIIIGITGASGSAYAYRTLEVLRTCEGVETHVVLSRQAGRTIELETGKSVQDFEALADVVHNHDDLAASISSGSFTQPPRASATRWPMTRRAVGQ